ncbi:TOG array regulator of axonemal microtubules protein 1, partial [Fragariocoptes setiger]
LKSPLNSNYWITFWTTMDINSDITTDELIGSAIGDRETSASSSSSSSPSLVYEPSASTCASALLRDTQCKIQSLLHQVLKSNDVHERVDLLRVLRKCLSEAHYRLSWLTQLDLFETIDRLLQDPSWRILNDCTLLLSDVLLRMGADVDEQTIAQLFARIIPNLGHKHSQVRRSSLLLLNQYINEQHECHFEHTLDLLIEYGLRNYRDDKAQRGCVLSLPLLFTDDVVKRHNMAPLVECLCELLVESDAQLFYALFLALQRLHQAVGDKRFKSYLSASHPEAALLYAQASSRSNSNSSAVDFQQQQQQRRQSQPSSVSLTACRSSNVFRGEKESNDAPVVSGNESQAQAAGAAGAGAAAAAAAAGQQQSQKSVTFSNRRESQSSVAGPTTNEDNNKTKQVNVNQQSNESASSIVTSSASSSSSSTQSVSSRRSLPESVDPADYMCVTTNSAAPITTRHQSIDVGQSQAQQFAYQLINSPIPVNPLMRSPHSPYIISQEQQQQQQQQQQRIATTDDDGDDDSLDEQRFGIFPRYLITMALSSRQPDKIDALQQMMVIMRESPINHLAILLTYFDSFLDQFLARLMEHSDYKVELIAIDMIETIVVRTKVSTMAYMRPIVNLLVKSLGDSRSIFRENTIRVIHKIMSYLPPQQVIDVMFEHKHSKNVLVREEVINRVTAAVLLFDKTEFNLTKLCYHVIPMLADHYRSVRLAALECLAVLAYALGPERIGSLLTAAEAVQTGCDYDGLLDAIHARLMRKALPRCNADGSIRYVIKPFLSASASASANANCAMLPNHEHQAADIVWLMQAAPHASKYPTSTSTTNLTTATHSNAAGRQRTRTHTHTHTQPLGIRSNSSVGLDNATEHQHQHQRCCRNSKSNCAHVESVTEATAISKATGSTSSTYADANSNNNKHKDNDNNSSSLNGDHNGNGNVTAADDAPAAKLDKEKSNAKENEKKKESEDRNNIKSEARRVSNNIRRQSFISSERRASTNVAPATRAPEKRRQSVHEQQHQQQQRQRRSDNDLVDNTPSCSREQMTRPQNRRKMSGLSGETMAQIHLENCSSQYPTRRLSRSNSQESASSTSTSKEMFRYYLHKFKQSLSEATCLTSGTALPSDSIIYTDSPIVGYSEPELISRFQQTSFDYGAQVAETDRERRADDSLMPNDENIRGGAKQQSHTVASSIGPQLNGHHTTRHSQPMAQAPSSTSSSSAPSPVSVMEMMPGISKATTPTRQSQTNDLTSKSRDDRPQESQPQQQQQQQTRQQEKQLQRGDSQDTGALDQEHSETESGHNTIDRPTNESANVSDAPHKVQKQTQVHHKDGFGEDKSSNQQRNSFANKRMTVRSRTISLPDDDQTEVGPHSSQVASQQQHTSSSRRSFNEPQQDDGLQQSEQQHRVSKTDDSKLRSGEIGDHLQLMHEQSTINHQSTDASSTRTSSSVADDSAAAAATAGVEVNAATLSQPRRLKHQQVSMFEQQDDNDTVRRRDRDRNVDVARDDAAKNDKQQKSEVASDESAIGDNNGKTHEAPLATKSLHRRRQHDYEEQAQNSPESIVSSRSSASLIRTAMPIEGGRRSTSPNNNSNSNNFSDDDNDSGARVQYSDHGTQTPSRLARRAKQGGQQQAARQTSRRRSSRLGASSPDNIEQQQHHRSSNGGHHELAAQHNTAHQPTSSVRRRRQSKSQPPPTNRMVAPRAPPTGRQSNVGMHHQAYHNGGGGGGGASSSMTPTRHSTTVRASTTHRDHHRDLSSSYGGSQRHLVTPSPSMVANVNIRQILENVAEIEGPFQDARLAFKVAMNALDSEAWSTKVEGMLALIRLATYHQELIINCMHDVVSRTANETRNLRSTVARSAIFALGDYCVKLKRHIEPELDLIVQILLAKSVENTAFIRDDIRKAFVAMVAELTPWKLALSLINHGSAHKNLLVRRMASEFICALVDKMGATKCMVGSKDISDHLIPAAARFSQDSSPHTRYYGRRILAVLMTHSSFERLMRKHCTPSMYRNTIGIVESIKRRGAGERPLE